MEPKSSVAKQKIAVASWQGSRSARSVLLLQMAEDEERRAGQAARIKALRESVRDPDTNRPLTQENLARALFVATRTVQNWEAGKGIDPENAKRLSDYLLSHGIAWATVDYIENGVVERQHGPTPDLSHDRALIEVREQLQALDARLDQMVNKLEESPIADQLAAIAERMASKIDAADSLNEGRAQEVRQRTEEGFAAIEDLLRRRRRA